MNEKDLRLGNQLMLNDTIVTFDASHWYQIGECTLFLEDFKPIPLTEEWLIKMGFENFHKRDFEKKGLFITTYFATPQTLVDDNFGNKRVLELKYVHQLQNLYYALCGEELTIKI